MEERENPEGTAEADKALAEGGPGSQERGCQRGGRRGAPRRRAVTGGGWRYCLIGAGWLDEDPTDTPRLDRPSLARPLL